MNRETEKEAALSSAITAIENFIDAIEIMEYYEINK
jgi:hypothetical protein